MSYRWLNKRKEEKEKKTAADSESNVIYVTHKTKIIPSLYFSDALWLHGWRWTSNWSLWKVQAEVDEGSEAKKES